MTAPSIPAICAALAADAVIARALAERADRLLRPTRPQDLEVRRASAELADRLARRSADLRGALDALAADLGAMGAGLWEAPGGGIFS
jgi:hypothetical protein